MLPDGKFSSSVKPWREGPWLLPYPAPSIALPIPGLLSDLNVHWNHQSRLEICCKLFFSCDLSYPSLNDIFYRRETLNFSVVYIGLGFPGGASGKEHTFESGRHKTWVQSLGREDPWVGGGHGYSLQYSCLYPMDRGAWQATVHKIKKH